MLSLQCRPLGTCNADAAKLGYEAGVASSLAQPPTAVLAEQHTGRRVDRLQDSNLDIAAPFTSCQTVRASY